MNHALSLKWMASSKRRAVYLLFFVGLFLIRLHPLTAAEKPLPDLQGFLQEVKKKMLERNEGKDVVENYTYRKRLVEESLKNDRQVKNTEVKEYEVYHFKEGAYQKLVAKNGVPLSPQELKKQDAEQAEKRRKQLAREAALTPKERQAKVEQSRRERQQQIDEIFLAFHFEPQGREVLHDRPTIVLRFTPRPEARLESRVGKTMLKKIAGKVWIEENEHVLLKVEVKVMDNLTWGGGLLAKVDKGTEFMQEWHLINNKDWLPRRTEMRGQAKVLLVKGFHLHRWEEYSNYQKLTVAAATQF